MKTKNLAHQKMCPECFSANLDASGDGEAHSCNDCGACTDTDLLIDQDYLDERRAHSKTGQEWAS